MPEFVAIGLTYSLKRSRMPSGIKKRLIHDVLTRSDATENLMQGGLTRSLTPLFVVEHDVPKELATAAFAASAPKLGSERCSSETRTSRPPAAYRRSHLAR